MFSADRHATMTVFPQAQPFLKDLGIFVNDNDVITWPEVQVAFETTKKSRVSKIKLDHLKHHYCLLEHYMILGERHGFFDSMSRYTHYIVPPALPSVKPAHLPIHKSNTDLIVSSIFIGLMLIFRSSSSKKTPAYGWAGLGCFALSGLIMVHDWLNAPATKSEEDEPTSIRPN